LFSLKNESASIFCHLRTAKECEHSQPNNQTSKQEGKHTYKQTARQTNNKQSYRQTSTRTSNENSMGYYSKEEMEAIARRVAYFKPQTTVEWKRVETSLFEWRRTHVGNAYNRNWKSLKKKFGNGGGAGGGASEGGGGVVLTVMEVLPADPAADLRSDVAVTRGNRTE
jgi:hypothetical protein